MNDDQLADLLDGALTNGDDRALRDALMSGSGLPGPRLDLGLVASFAGAVGVIAARPDPPVDELERLLDGWRALSETEAPGDQPAAILPCAAVASYGEVAVVRPEWRDDEVRKLRAAASDSRWRVREVVAQSLQRLLEADWAETSSLLLSWAAEAEPLVARAAAAAVAEPSLVRDPDRARTAADIQTAAANSYRALPADHRRTDGGKALRQALGFTISVPTAVTGDFTLLDSLAATDDRDLRWIVRQNLRKARLRRWADDLARLTDVLAS